MKNIIIIFAIAILFSAGTTFGQAKISSSKTYTAENFTHKGGQYVWVFITKSMSPQDAQNTIWKTYWDKAEFIPTYKVEPIAMAHKKKIKGKTLWTSEMMEDGKYYFMGTSPKGTFFSFKTEDSEYLKPREHLCFLLKLR